MPEYCWFKGTACMLEVITGERRCPERVRPGKVLHAMLSTLYFILIDMGISNGGNGGQCAKGGTKESLLMHWIRKEFFLLMFTFCG